MFTRKRFAWFAIAVLVYNLAVIAWGAYVRASYSGDGCGDHWPTCGGQVLPTAMAKPKIIEFTHRMMTTGDVLATIALVAWAFVAFPVKHAVRRYAVLSFVFLMIEAALGAGLVLFRYVASDQSAGRVWYLSLHLTNTMLLLGVYTITAWLAYREQLTVPLGRMSNTIRWAVITVFVVSITGAITALGDTLFPSSSLAAGMQQDLALGTPMLLRLRMLHPAVAVLSSAYLIWAAVSAMRGQSEDSLLRKAGAHVITLLFVQIGAGVVNLLLSAPVWMQIVHLIIADVVWIAVVLLVCEEVHARMSSPADPGFSMPLPASTSSALPG